MNPNASAPLTSTTWSTAFPETADDIRLPRRSFAASPSRWSQLHRQWSGAGLQATQTPRSIAFCDHAIRNPVLMVVPDAAADVRFARNPLVTGPLGGRYAGMPW
ncbi:MAG: hypothetical protein IPO95_10345 [Rhodanobacteraceae bacterium]|nr:hypothetical protein [Rhodanobacteraceae bacterium]